MNSLRWYIQYSTRNQPAIQVSAYASDASYGGSHDEKREAYRSCFNGTPSIWTSARVRANTPLPT